MGLSVCNITYRGTVVEVIRGDITRLNIDAIVNPANSLMIMGGGVAGAIKRAGGNAIEEEARRYAPVPVGRAVATGGGRLRARYVIHSPTMERPAMRVGVDNVKLAVKAALKLCDELGIKEVAFPGMGTGVGGLSYDVASKAMCEVIKEHIDSGSTLRRVVLVAIDEDLHREFCKALNEVFQ